MNGDNLTITMGTISIVVVIVVIVV